MPGDVPGLGMRSSHAKPAVPLPGEEFPDAKH
jgi:hypothetical protein